MQAMTAKIKSKRDPVTPASAPQPRAAVIPTRRGVLLASALFVGVVALPGVVRAQGAPTAAPVPSGDALSTAPTSVPGAQPADGAPVPAPLAPSASPLLPAAPVPPASSPPPAPVPPPPVPPEPQDAEDTSAELPSLNLKVYADTSFIARTHAGPPFNEHSNWNTFEFPHFELFPTATYDRFSFLAEVMFEANNNEFDVDVERMQLAYAFAEWFKLKAGRFHTALGYYNDAYHHARLFELTTGRPYMVNFEDSEGLLPAHSVGVSAEGTLGQFRYDFDVGNGRSLDPTAVAVNDAQKNAKLWNLRLRWMPSFAEGLILGINLETDVFPGQASAGPPQDPPAYPNAPLHTLRERVAGAHVVYLENDWHLIAEGALIDHYAKAVDADYRTAVGFVEAGYAVGAFTPYARIEQIHFGKSRLGDLDPFYQLAIFRGVRDASDARVGVNWLVNEHVALKLEGRAFVLDKLDQESGIVQVAVGF